MSNQELSTNYTPKFAVFLDRDGTINEERGYLCTPDEITLLPTVCEALSLLNRLHIPVIIISNQSALGRGLMTQEEFEAVNQTFKTMLQECGANYDALYYCPHTPDRIPPCTCRKPRPGLLLQAAADFHLDLSRSFMIGDKYSDLQAGFTAGCTTVLVRTGFGEKTYQMLASQSQQPDYIAANLLEAVEWVVQCVET